MSELKKTIIGLKEIFKINNYASCKDLKLRDWFYELKFRYEVTHRIRQTASGVEDDEKNILKDQIYSILLNPLGHSGLKENEAYEITSHSPVVDMSIFSMLDHGAIERLPSNKKNELIDWANNFTTSEHEKIHIPKVLLESYHSALLQNNVYSPSSNFVPVEVDLDATNDDLIAAFKEWLEKKRMDMEKNVDAHPRKKSFTSKDCLSWSEKAVLPYIDLQIILKYFRINIPNHAIGDILFEDDEIDVGERVRKVTKPLADNLLSPHTLSALYFYV